MAPKFLVIPGRTTSTCLTERSCLPYGKGSAPSQSLRGLRLRVSASSAPAAFGYSSHRGGVRPGGILSSRILGEPPGSFIEPPSKRTIPPSADIQSRKANDNRPEAILVTGRRTLEARPPAMWFRATRRKTIRPNDQSNSITSLSPAWYEERKRTNPEPLGRSSYLLVSAMIDL